MSLFKRFATTIHATVDKTVAQLENHDAIVDAALKDSRSAVARARVRLARVEKDGRQQRARIQELQTEVALWEERAQSVAATDRGKALDCLRRRKQRESALRNGQASLTEHEALEKRVRASVAEAEQRVNTLMQQRNQMRSRESAAQALRIVNAIDDKAGIEIDDAFERWEISISESEVFSGQAITPVDEFEELNTEFETLEEQQQLDAELDLLLENNQEKNNE